MLLLVSYPVLGLLTLGPQVVLGSFKFKLPPVVQCEPVNLTFSGSDANNHSVPTTLTVLPLLNNVAPIQIPIPNGASNSTGIQLTFIPLPADTLFIASLDGTSGPSAVSDVTKVNSTIGAGEPPSVACLGEGPVPANFYKIDGALGQCETFTVTYSTTNAPNITAFIPRQISFQVPTTGDSSGEPGKQSYIMPAVRGLQVSLLFDDGESHLQTTELITVSGDSSSSKSCFPDKNAKDSDSDSPKTKKSTGVSKAALIGITVGASVVGVVAILMLLFVLRERRRRRRAADMSFDPALLNKKWPPDEKRRDIEEPPPFTAPPPFSAGGYVRDPIYTDEKYADSYRTSVMSDSRTSIASWNQFVPEDQRSQIGRGAPKERRVSGDSSRLSMNTLDIQNILQMATVHRDRSSVGHDTPAPSTAGTAMTSFDVAKPAVARLVSSGRSRRSDPPDMPMRNPSMGTGLPSEPRYGPTSYMSFADSDEEPATGRPGGAGIGGFPVPASRGNHRDTSESWGNVIVR
ncbi:hypothetical protein B0H10DRAFT_2214872 [Mycena sp. CBHHK59/15]|nr:hypothetical protein B0H10DRAFT_2214872 [Mycena sp. CBHHK59/15]